MVSDEPEKVPERLYMISTAIFITSEPEDAPLRAPTDKEMRVISTAEARQMFGTEAERMDGVSVSTHSELRSGLVTYIILVVSIRSETIVCPITSSSPIFSDVGVASRTTTTGPPSYSSDSGGHIPPSTLPFRRQEKHHSPLPAACFLRTSMQPTGVITRR